MTAKTPVFQIEYLVEGEPIRATRLALENNAKSIEAALLAGPASPPAASDLAVVAGRVTALETLPICVLRQTAQTALAAGWTIIPWQTEDYDPDDLHSPTTNASRVTIKKKGLYRLAAQVPVVAGSGGTLWAKWMRNGTVIPGSGQSTITTAANANGQAAPVGTVLVTLNVNDYIELQIGLTSASGTWTTMVQATGADGIGGMCTVQCLRLLP